MAAIRDIDSIASKWTTVTPQRVGDYQQGVAAPRVDWKQATAAANDAYKGAMQTALQQDSFRKGVNASSTERWQEGALNKGTQRWGPGIQLGGPNYRSGFAPYRDAIARLSLPTRFARRDPRNLERVKAVVQTLIDTKTRQGAAT